MDEAIRQSIAKGLLSTGPELLEQASPEAQPISGI